MSDYMTNVEIDDVLSSIRRLVSEDKPKKPALSPGSDRFVLTPALRVMEDVAPTPVRKEPAQSSETSAPLELRQYLATPAVDAPMPPQPPQPSVSPEFMAMEQAWESELAQFSSQHSTDATPSPSAAAEPTSLESRIAELEAAVSQAGEEWEPDGSEPDFGKPPRHHIFEVVDNTARHETEPRQDTDADDGDLNDRADVDFDADTNAAEIQDLEPAEMPFFSHGGARSPEKSPEKSPDRPPESSAAPANSDAPADVPPPQMASEPKIEPQVEHELSPTQAPAPIPFPPSGKVVEDDDVFLDVEALRDMISDAVRAELRGKMGETITRNVRRMVQQEIARALTHQDPD